MPVLETPGGSPVEVPPVEDINSRFAEAMNSDGPDDQAPPKRQPKTHGESVEVSKPRRGRPPAAEKSRTTEKPSVPVKDDYSEDARTFVGTVWTVAASLPPTQPYALVVEANSDALSGALAEGAKHNSTIRSFVESGQSSWILSLASVGLSMGMQTLQLMRDPELRKQAAETTREHLRAAMGAKGLDVQDPAPVPAAA